MNKSLNAFVERQNVLHYIDLLKTETELANAKYTSSSWPKQSAAEQRSKNAEAHLHWCSETVFGSTGCRRRAPKIEAATSMSGIGHN